MSDLIATLYGVQIKMKNASSKKSQSLLKSMLNVVFQDEGVVEIFCNLMCRNYGGF
jgi:hypothetical protein